jgi:hypothetical protein
MDYVAVRTRTAHRLLSEAVRLSATTYYGRDFATGLRDALVESWEWTISNDNHDGETGEQIADYLRASDILHEIADSAVPVYTDALWQTFVTLAAYQIAGEALADLGYSVKDVEEVPKVALYFIASQIVETLLSDLAEEYDEQRAEVEAAVEINS